MTAGFMFFLCTAFLFVFFRATITPEVSILPKLEKNDVFTCEITGYTAEGNGVAHIMGRAVFVPGAIPGETWEVKLLKVAASTVYAKGIRLISSSPARIPPECHIAGKCGGCALAHMDYHEELRMKLAKVNDALRRIGGCEFSISEIIAAEHISGYRNKGITAVGSTNGHAAAGFYRSRSHDILPAPDCLLQSEAANRINRAVCQWMDAYNIPPYNEITGKGTVRHIFTRTNRDGQVHLTIISARGFGSATGTLAPVLLKDCPELCGITLCVNKSRGNSVLDGTFHLLWGSETISETLCGHTFHISPQSFFQINPDQTEWLYDKAVQYAAPHGGTVLDLYCGTGTISLCLAAKADRVIGAEIVPEAVENARKNADANEVKNVEFICADAGQAAGELARRGIRPDAIVVDPPRKGMYENTIDAIGEMSPARLVYVSCDPATLARDMKRLSAHSYAVTAGTAVDMFPRTHHVETVVLMEKLL